MVASLIALAVLGYSPIGNALIIPLEQRFPPWDAARGAPDGIVVLGGAISPDVSTARNDVALNEAAERMTAVVDLARRYPQARIVFSGGSPALIFGEAPEADFALRLFDTFGIARERIAARGAVAQHRRERGVLQADRAAEAGRALAAGNLGLSHARARSASSARPASRSRPIRSIGARAATQMRCGRSRRWARACGGPTRRCANGSDFWPIG